MGSHVLSVDGRRHIPPDHYGGPETWRLCERGKMAAGAERGAVSPPRCCKAAMAQLILKKGRDLVTRSAVCLQNICLTALHSLNKQMLPRI